MITIGSVIETKERQNVSAGQQIVEGLLKKKKKDYNWECDDNDQEITTCKCGTVNCKGFIERV